MTYSLLRFTIFFSLPLHSNVPYDSSLKFIWMNEFSFVFYFICASVLIILTCDACIAPQFKYHNIFVSCLNFHNVSIVFVPSFFFTVLGKSTFFYFIWIRFSLVSWFLLAHRRSLRSIFSISANSIKNNLTIFRIAYKLGIIHKRTNENEILSISLFVIVTVVEFKFNDAIVEKLNFISLFWWLSESVILIELKLKNVKEFSLFVVVVSS